MNSQECLKIIARIETTWSIVFDNMRKEIYGENLADLDYQKTVIVIKKLTQTEKFTPTIAHIRETYVDLTEPQIDVSKAVELVFTTIRGGRHKWKEGLEYIKAEDSIAYQIVRQIGYIDLCNGNPDFTRPEFEKLYREAVKIMKVEKSMPDKLLAQIASFKANLIKANIAQIGCDDE